MATRVNSWNEWDPLKRVVLGRPEGTSICAPEPGWWHDIPEGGFPLGTWGPLAQDMVDGANEQMDNLAAILAERGVTVDRVTIHPSMLDGRAVSTPDWTQINQHGANNARDEFITIGKELVEATGSRRSRWYEYLAMRPLLEQYFREDEEFLWTAAPKPRLTDESFVPNWWYYYNNIWTDEEKNDHLKNWEFRLTEKEPLWSAADAMRMGKDILWQASSTTNRSGMDWLKRYFGAKGLRIHTVQFWGDLHPWHMDSVFVPLRPGLAMYCPDKMPITNELFELFKANEWELVAAARPTYVHRNKVRMYEEYGKPYWTSMNTLSLGPNTICVEAHETAYIDQLDKMGFEVVPVPYERVVPFGGSLHCTTCDVYRDSKCEDYFPNQITGF